MVDTLRGFAIVYIMRSLIYCGIGLGLYRYTGAGYAVLIGTGLATAQGLFSAWCLKHHKRGHLETLWHILTRIGTRDRID